MRYLVGMREGSPNPPLGAALPTVLDRLLIAHPRSVGESYAEHAGIAARFGAAMVTGGVKCLIHAVVPALFDRSASDCVARLDGELTRRRAASADSCPDYVI